MVYAYKAGSLLIRPLLGRMKAPHPAGSVPHRGYSGVGTEQGGAKTASETDDKELKASILKMADYKARETA